jgi:hypothetical protein
MTLILAFSFFVSLFGPWVGIGVTGIGFFFVNFIGWYFPWWNTPPPMLVAFFADLFVLKTKGSITNFAIF